MVGKAKLYVRCQSPHYRPGHKAWSSSVTFHQLQTSIIVQIIPPFTSLVPVIACKGIRNVITEIIIITIWPWWRWASDPWGWSCRSCCCPEPWRCSSGRYQRRTWGTPSSLPAVTDGNSSDNNSFKFHYSILLFLSLSLYWLMPSVKVSIQSP